MDLYQHMTKKNLLWLAGTLLIGALGSGLWEAALKPAMVWFGTLMLDVGTLGLVSLRDGMYVDVAKGSYERAGLYLLSMATGLFCGFMAAPVIAAMLLRKRDEEGRPSSRVASVMRKNWICDRGSANILDDLLRKPFSY